MGLLIGIWIICAVLSFAVATIKGRSELMWAGLGFLFGPAAIVVILVLPKSDEKANSEAMAKGELTLCPFCRESVKSEAVKCKHCQSDLSVADQDSTEGRIAHERLQKAIYDGDTEAATAILDSDFDVSANPLPFSHLEYAEMHGSEEMIELVSAKTS